MRRYKKVPLEIIRVSEPIHGIPMSSPRAVLDYMKTEVLADREMFWILYINNKNKIIKKEMTAMGATDHCVIVPGIVLRGAVAYGAPAIITVHNHPSGDPSPSDEDKKLWKTMHDGCSLLGIRLLDNIIVGMNGYFSEAETKR